MGERAEMPRPKPIPDPVRTRRLRADASRSMSTNLADDGVALSHALLRFTGVARRG